MVAIESEILKADYFQNLFYNSIFWALGYDVPENGILSAGKEFEPIPEKTAYTKEEKNIPFPPQFNGDNEWEILFDGKDLSQWRHYDISIAPNMIYLDLRASSEGPIDYTLSGARWKVENRAALARPGFGDIITKQHYNNYRLRFDFLYSRISGLGYQRMEGK